MNLGFDAKMPDLSGLGYRKIGVGCLIAVSVLLLWWSLTMRFSLIGEAQSKINASFGLEQDIAVLESRWSAEEAAQIEAQVAKAERRLLDGYDHLARWLMALTNKVAASGYQMEFKMEEAQSESQRLPGVQVVPVRLSIGAERKPEAYGEFVGTIRKLIEDPIRVDIQEVTISGVGRGAHRMDLLLHAMMREPQ